MQAGWHCFGCAAPAFEGLSWGKIVLAIEFWNLAKSGIGPSGAGPYVGRGQFILTKVVPVGGQVTTCCAGKSQAQYWYQVGARLKEYALLRPRGQGFGQLAAAHQALLLLAGREEGAGLVHIEGLTKTWNEWLSSRLVLGLRQMHWLAREADKLGAGA